MKSNVDIETPVDCHDDNSDDNNNNNKSIPK